MIGNPMRTIVTTEDLRRLAKKLKLRAEWVGSDWSNPSSECERAQMYAFETIAEELSDLANQIEAGVSCDDEESRDE